ncbi:uncharacterized protein VP01_12048g1, partial [Puccinia sorghi]
PSATLAKLQEIVHLEESRKAKTVSSIAAKPSTDEPVEGASALIHEYKKGKKKKQGVYCDPGKHNPAATSHDAEHCCQSSAPHALRRALCLRSELFFISPFHLSRLLRSCSDPLISESSSASS